MKLNSCSLEEIWLFFSQRAREGQLLHIYEHITLDISIYSLTHSHKHTACPRLHFIYKCWYLVLLEMPPGNLFIKTVTGRVTDICGNLGVNRIFSHDFSNSSTFLEAYRKECHEVHSSLVDKEHLILHFGAADTAVPMLMRQSIIHHKRSLLSVPLVTG